MATTPKVAQTRFSLGLDEVRARDPAVGGSKAASLATARSGGMPVLPGFVVTTAAPP